MENTITFYMLEDHKAIDEKLAKLLDGFGMSREEIRQLYKNFFIHLEKHLQTEEKAIFSFSEYEDAEIRNTIQELLEEHSKMRELLKMMSKEIENGRPRGFDNFITLLRRHQDAENNSLYPKLDRELDEPQKNFILNKIVAFR